MLFDSSNTKQEKQNKKDKNKKFELCFIPTKRKRLLNLLTASLFYPFLLTFVLYRFVFENSFNPTAFQTYNKVNNQNQTGDKIKYLKKAKQKRAQKEHKKKVASEYPAEVLTILICACSVLRLKNHKYFLLLNFDSFKLAHHKSYEQKCSQPH